jgi:hypothetical protein
LCRVSLIGQKLKKKNGLWSLGRWPSRAVRGCESFEFDTELGIHPSSLLQLEKKSGEKSASAVRLVCFLILRFSHMMIYFCSRAEMSRSVWQWLAGFWAVETPLLA